MAKIFYDHLIYIDEVVAELDKHKISVEERQELIELTDQTLHHEALNIILKNLPIEKHEEFLSMFHKSPGDSKLLDFLKTDVADIEDKIRETAIQVKKDLLAEIKRATK